MSTLSRPATFRANHVSRPAPRHAPVVVQLPVACETVESPLASLLAEVRAVAETTGTQSVPRSPTSREEFATQDLALAGESADLRARASEYASAIEAGGTVPSERIETVLRSFRSYESFLDDRDRRLNAAAYRRLAGAVDATRTLASSGAA